MLIDRDFYLDRLVRNMWNGEVKVVTGIRRCGKSVLLFDLFRRHLLSIGVPEDHIIAIRLDEMRYSSLRNPIALCEYVESIVLPRPEERFYLLIDEVQLAATIPDRPRKGLGVGIYDMLNELGGRKNLDVYVTGSNSRGLSKDIATEFRGRTTQIRLYPLSFAEYYSAVGGGKSEALDNYMIYGGMPRLAGIDDDMEKRNYLQTLYKELYIKDIVERNRIGRGEILGGILDHLASRIGSLSTPHSIAAALSGVSKEKVSQALVASYLDHIMDSFLVDMARRYDVKGKSYFRYPNKYYFVDPGLRNARLDFRRYDKGRLMENIVYTELARQGFGVDVGVVADRENGANAQREIDFVVNNADRRVYIQSAFQMAPDSKASSELRPLMLTNDFFKKIVLRMDMPGSFYDNDGILHASLIDFLLGKVGLF